MLVKSSSWGKYKLPEIRINSGQVTRKFLGKSQATRNKISKEPETWIISGPN